MASGTFETTSLEWQLQQLSQQVGEWFEGLLASRMPNLPDAALPNLPAWFLRGLFWLVATGVVLWASWQLYRLAEPYLGSGWRSRGNRSAVAPPSRQQSLAVWLQQARMAQQQGDYRTACRALYMAALQQLHERGLVSQVLSRTDGEYLSLVQAQNLPQPYQVLIHAHERLCFDRVAASPELYDRCWQAYQEIEQG